MALSLQKPANPAAGDNFTVTVPTGKFWRIHSIYAKFVTSAGVANRVVKLFIDDGAANVWQLSNEVAQTASLTTTYGAFPGASVPSVPVAADAARNYAIPDIILSPGYRIRSAVAAIQVGDQWSEIAILVDESVMEYALNRAGAR